MIDPNRVTEAVNEFMKNPTWKDIFMNAPGGAMERLAIAFYFSKYHDEFQPEDFQEYRDLRDEYEKSMTEEDLNYLIETSDKPNAIKHYQELLEKLQKNGGTPTGNMRFEKPEQQAQEQGAEQQEGNEQNTTAEPTPAEAEQPPADTENQETETSDPEQQVQDTAQAERRMLDSSQP